MKKSNLLALTVPAMLAAVSCGAGVNQKSTIVRTSNSQVSVDIVCRNCLVRETNESHDQPISEPTSVFSNKYEYAESTTKYFTITADPNDPLAVLPDEIDFRIGGVASSKRTYKTKTEKEGDLSFTLPEDPVTVFIDATVQCIDFTVVPIPEHTKVSFDYVGALDHIDWGDGKSTTETSYVFEPDYATHTVRVFGNITSVWFTDRKEPTSNSSLLGNGNDRITELNINHAVETLPNYAFNGCQGLQKVYIGESVENMGKKVFVMDRNQEGEIEIHDPKSIYCSRVSKPSTWDTEWTDCPVSYGVGAKEYTDKNVGLAYRLVNTNKGDTTAIITGTGTSAISSELQIPAGVYDGNKEYVVRSVAPFAFYGNSVIQEVSFGTKTSIQPEANKCVEIGAYAFARASIKSFDLNGVIDMGSPFKIDEGAFFEDGALNEVKFPEFQKEGSELIIGEKAFMHTSSFKNIELPGTSFTLTTIGKRAFQDSSFNGFIIPKSSNTYFPSSIITLGDEAFMDCKGLDSDNLVIGGNVESMGEKVFYSANIESIRVVSETKPEGWSEDWNIRYEGKGEEPERLPVFWGYVDKLVENGITYYITKQGDKQTATVVKYESTGEPEIEILDTVSYGGGVCDVVAIADNAFAGILDFTSVVIPASVTKVGRYAFGNCSPLLKVFYKGSDVSNWDPEWTRPNINNQDVGAALYTNYDDKITSTMTSSNFDIVKETTSKTDPYNAAILEYKAPGVAEEITIPATLKGQKGEKYNVTSVGGKSFLGADLSAGLKWADNPNLTSIGTGAFGMATFKEGEMSIPTTIQSIGCGAFAMSKGITALKLKTNTALKSIGLGAFAGLPASDITLPDGVDVDGYAFYGCANLGEVNLTKANMTAIPERLFNMCTSYKDLVDENGMPTGNLQLPSAIESIDESAFAGTGIVIADLSSYTELTTIGPTAFGGCQSLTRVNLPASLTTIGNGAFGVDKVAGKKGCENLSVIDLSTNTNVPTVSPRVFGGQIPAAFQDKGEGKIYVPKGPAADESKYLKQYTEAWKDVFTGYDAEQFFAYPPEE